MDSVTDVLRGARLFDALTSEEIDALLTVLERRTVAAGAVVIDEGDPGGSMFVIGSGQVRVSPNAASRTVLARLGSGEFFGEMALLEGTPRTAAVLAERETVLLELDRDQLAALGADHPDLLAHVGDVIRSRRARGLTAADEASTLRALGASDATITVGRATSCTVVIDDPSVSAVHVELRRSAGGLVVVDRSGGKAFVNDIAFDRAPIADGDELRLGNVRLFIDRGLLKRFSGPAGVRVEATKITVRRGRRTTLDDVPVAISPGELVAIVGPSGAGKTTLLRVLLGLDAPASGIVSYDGLAVRDHADAFRSVLGYVPQDDIVHPDLTLVESLSYAARLRLPPDTQVAERMARIDLVLVQLGLHGERHSLVRNLSGGQRKRASIALELLTGPRLLFMDEPTSGLDPARDERMIELFRSLADQGRTVVLTTHATRNIHLCDRLIVLSEGRLAFSGSPAEALDYFGVDDFAEIYGQLEAADPAQLTARLLSSPVYQRAVAERLLAAAPAAARGRGWGAAGSPAHGLRQLLPLALRSLRVASRDRVNMALRLAGPPFLGVALAVTFDRSIFEFESADGGNALSGITFLYLLAAITLFLGAFTSANAITSEAAIFRRERLVGLSPAAYVLGKASILGAFSVIQSVLLIGTVAIFIRLPGPQPEVFFQLVAATSLVSIAGMGLGLFVSSLSPNSDRAAILVVLLLIPQLIFAGATVPRRDMKAPALVISDATISKWALELSAGITGIRDKEAHQAFASVTAFPGVPDVLVPIPDEKRPFAAAFRNDLKLRWFVIAGFGAGFIAATLAVQSLKGRLSVRGSPLRRDAG